MGRQMLEALKRAGLSLERTAVPITNGRPKAAAETTRKTLRDGEAPARPERQPWPPVGVRSTSPQQSTMPMARPAAAAAVPNSLVHEPIRITRTTREERPATAPIVRPTSAAAQERKEKAALIKEGVFCPHPLFDEGMDGAGVLADFTLEGIRRQLASKPEDATDLTIGLDFGTSSTKVVIRDAFASPGVFPVRLAGKGTDSEAYLLPSRVYKCGDVYSLSKTGTPVVDLKLRLLTCNVARPVTQFNDCCAFLALVIRQSRGWLFTEHRDAYARHELNWRVNLGIAARSYQEADKVDLFRRLAWAAANLACDSEASTITVDAVDKYRKLAWDVIGGAGASSGSEWPIAVSEIDVVPEVSAQLHGFMLSANWDWGSRPIMMLVDVGAGTVDTALFHVRPQNKERGTLTFYASRVEPNGVMNLHRDRVAWLQRMLPSGAEHQLAREYLDRIGNATDMLRPIPSGCGEYLSGYRLSAPGDDVDRKFHDDRYRRQVVGSIHEARTRKGIDSGQLDRVPVLLCGGGSRMQMFAGIAETINQIKEWTFHVEKAPLPVPPELVDLGWHSDDYDRISVAYGLSFSGDDKNSLGKIVRAIEVPDVPRRTTVDRDDWYVSKDQM